MRKLKVLHLSDTQLSGSPIRISKLLNKYSEGRIESRHFVWTPTVGTREFETDLIGSRMYRDEAAYWILEWADVIHYHNRWRRQEVFRQIGYHPPKKPSLIQMHSPRYEKEKFVDEAKSGLPIAVIAQYHVREWPELSFIVPNVVDINDDENRREQAPLPVAKPVVSYAPSNTTCTGWNSKGYDIVAPALKRMKLRSEIIYQLLVSLPHKEVMARKRLAHIGIDEIVTGSYHLSSLEYLSLGIACFANLDLATEKVVKDLTGCDQLPWLKASEANFASRMRQLVYDQSWFGIGLDSRAWMERHWRPDILLGHYERMYEKVLGDFRP